MCCAAPFYVQVALRFRVRPRPMFKPALPENEYVPHMRLGSITSMQCLQPSFSTTSTSSSTLFTYKAGGADLDRGLRTRRKR